MDRLPDLVETIYYGGTVLCQWHFAWFRTNFDRPAKIPSIALFCPKCGDIWARRHISAPQGVDTKDYFDWRVNEVKCKSHGGGQILTDRELDDICEYTDAPCPEELLHHELMISLGV